MVLMFQSNKNCSQVFIRVVFVYYRSQAFNRNSPLSLLGKLTRLHVSFLSTTCQTSSNQLANNYLHACLVFPACLINFKARSQLRCKPSSWFKIEFSIWISSDSLISLSPLEKDLKSILVSENNIWWSNSQL